MFCATSQISFWYKFLLEKSKRCMTEACCIWIPKETSRDKNEAVFHVRSVMVHYTPLFETYSEHPEVLKTHHTHIYWSTLFTSRKPALTGGTSGFRGTTKLMGESQQSVQGVPTY